MFDKARLLPEYMLDKADAVRLKKEFVQLRGRLAKYLINFRKSGRAKAGLWAAVGFSRGHGGALARRLRRSQPCSRLLPRRSRVRQKVVSDVHRRRVSMQPRHLGRAQRQRAGCAGELDSPRKYTYSPHAIHTGV